MMKRWEANEVGYKKNSDNGKTYLDVECNREYLSMVYLLGVNTEPSYLIILGVYGGYAHQNDGTHLHGGITENSI